MLLAILLASNCTLVVEPTPLRTVATAPRRAFAPAIGVGTHVPLRLRPMKALTLVATPGRAAAADSFGGLVTLDVPSGGRLVVRLSNRAYVDLVGTAGVITSASHGRPAGCTTMHKEVHFDVTAGRYVLQLTGSFDRYVYLFSTLTEPKNT